MLSESKQEFIDIIEKPQLGLIDLLKKYRSIDLPIEAFFSISNKIMVRSTSPNFVCLAKVLHNSL
jgi:hypothetical protein